MVGCSTNTPSSTTPLAESTTVNVTVQGESETTHFNQEILKIKLYKYNPMIAGKSATLVEEITKKLDDKYPSIIYKTKIGTKAYRDPQSKYYITVYVVNKEGKRTHYGYKNGTEGFSKVLENNNRDVLMVLKYKG